MGVQPGKKHFRRSRSLRARGLKRDFLDSVESITKVALFTGAWIETRAGIKHIKWLMGRALYGRVD